MKEGADHWQRPLATDSLRVPYGELREVKTLSLPGCQVPNSHRQPVRLFLRPHLESQFG